MTNLYHKLKGLFQSKKTYSPTLTGTQVDLGYTTDNFNYAVPAWGSKSTALSGVCCGGETAVCAYKDSRGNLHASVELRDRAEKSYLLYDARSEYYKALHIAYREGSWYDYSQKEVKTLIDAAQKYYDLCTDIS